MRISHLTLRLSALAAVAGLTAITATPAIAAESTGVISWSVIPASIDGPDGRRWVDIDVDPGAVVEDHLAVTNHSDEDVTFRLSAADARFTDAGRFDMLPASESSTGAGTWISVQEDVRVPSKGTVVVPFSIRVPSNATPGDNAAGLAASFVSSTADQSGSQVGLDSRVGFRVMMRVAGELTPALEIAEASAVYKYSWNPFQAGSLDVEFTERNAGNVRLFASATVQSSGVFSEDGSDAVTNQELLPGDARASSHSVAGVWPIGLLRVVVQDTGRDSLDGEMSSTAGQTEIWVWALPLPQLVLLLGVGMLLLGLLWRRRRRRVHLQALLASARREGRESAMASSSSTSGAQ